MLRSQEPRSHRRLVSAIERQAVAREKKLAAGKLSLPSGEGILAIIVSNQPDSNSPTPDDRQRQAFHNEAERLQEQRRTAHQEVVIRRRAVARDIKFDLTDPEITDVIMIGHGSIGCLWTEKNGRLDWHMVAKATSALKQGKIEQRMCGGFRKQRAEYGATREERIYQNYSVPLGTFAVSNLGNLLAAPNVIVPDVNPPDALFKPVFADEQDVVAQIAALNEQHAAKPATVWRPESAS